MLGDRLEQVRDSIRSAAQRAGRDERELTLIVVTKFQPVSVIEELSALGITDFGESRHQEASQKASQLAGRGLRWHFVGQLQSKKARAVASYCQVVHSLDRESLLEQLSQAPKPIDCFIELNLTDDPGRGGVPISNLIPFAEKVLAQDSIRLLGVMAVASIGKDPRSEFAKVRDASESLKSIAPNANFISAGMSGDFQEAILEGATHLRIGTAITGPRPQSG